MKTVYIVPENTRKINEIYVVLSEDNGGEGIVNANVGGAGYQLVTGNPDNLEKITILCKQIARDTGKKLKLYKFTGKELIEKIG